MHNDKHIASAFDRDLETVQSLIMKMGGMVEESITLAAQAFEEGDVELAQQVRAGDKKIDAIEEEVNEEVARLIALRAPIASDLRTALTVMKIATNLERCGDYSKNLAKRTAVLIDMPPIEGAARSIRRMSGEVQEMLKMSLDAYLQRDVELAEQVRLRDLDVDQMYNGLFREFLTHMMEDPRHITACMHLHFIAKNIERMGDHATSIAEQVIYLVTGEVPDEPRQKGRLPTGQSVSVKV